MVKLFRRTKGTNNGVSNSDRCSMRLVVLQSGNLFCSVREQKAGWGSWTNNKQSLLLTRSIYLKKKPTSKQICFKLRVNENAKINLHMDT